MTATFTIKVQAIQTGVTEKLTNVIKRVDFTVIGSEQGQTFELPQSLGLGDPDEQTFISLEKVTEENVIEWIENNFNDMEAVKNHIQYVLNKEVAKLALTATPLPWAPKEATNPA